MNGKAKLRLFGFIAVAGIWAAVFTAGRSKGVLPPTGSPVAPAVPAVQPGTDIISTFTLVGHTDTGRKKWEVQGETADLMAQTVQLSPVAATSFGQTDVHLTAKQGQFDRASENVHLQGDVVVTTTDGARLTADSLDWNQAAETGTTPDRVVVTRQGMTVTGTGGVGHPKLKQVRIQKDVTVTIEDPAKGKTVITCDGPMDVDYGVNRARFWKNVVVRDAKGLIQSDRMDVGLDPKTNRVEKATFWGHVEIHQEGKTATANRANYWQSAGRIQLIGHPKLVMIPQDGKVLE